MATVVVDTRYYENNYGKAPRGRGGWAFCSVDVRRPDYLDHVIWTPSLPYGEARKFAVAEAAKRGVSVLYVCT